MIPGHGHTRGTGPRSRHVDAARRWLVVLGYLVLLPVVPAAGAQDRDRTLKGIDAVLVDASSLGEAARHGVAADAIRAAVEARLQRLGIRVVGQEERDARRLPTLFLRGLVLPHPSGVTAYYAAVEVWQLVSVSRGTAATPAYVPAWSSLGYLGSVDGAPALPARFREVMAEQLDQFVDAFVAANGRR